LCPKRANNDTFTERAKTAVVNAHGGLILLCEPVVTGQMLKIHNIVTNEELVCTVMDINPGQNGLPEVGVEFAQPNPRFWHGSFPPVDWNPRNPAAKRFDTSNHTYPSN